MNKVYGRYADYVPLREDRSRTIAAYGCKAEPDGEHATWYEVYYYKRRDGVPTLERIKADIKAGIDEQTRERIVAGLTWNQKPVWLSTENQLDWKAAYDRALQTDGANLPVKFKLGEDGDGNPVYHTFTSLNAFGDFTDAWQQHIQQCLQDGWKAKDSMDWSIYANALDSATAAM